MTKTTTGYPIKVVRYDDGVRRRIEYRQPSCQANIGEKHPDGTERPCMRYGAHRPPLT